jgi:hypothetical protein
MALGASWQRGEMAAQGGAQGGFAQPNVGGQARRVDRVLAHGNVRFVRLNFSDSQANAYLLTALGGRGVTNAENFASDNRRVLPASEARGTMWNPTGALGLTVDAEDLTRYGALEARTVQDRGGPRLTRATSAKARLGLLPYEPEANEVAGWLMTETSAVFGREDGERLHRAGKWDFSPGARIFYRQFLTEVFVPLSGGLRVIFMYHL